MAISIFILGVQKCGTTLLAGLLNGHPDVFVPPIKETYFHALDSEWKKGVDWLAKEHFSTAPAGVRWAEATPFNLISETALERIAQTAPPEARFIVCLREPIARAHSHWWNATRDERETLDFEAGLAAEAERREINRAEHGRWWRHAYVEVGLYAPQLKRAFDILGRDRVLVLDEQDLRDPAARAAAVCAHLDLDPAGFPATAEGHAGGMPKSRTINRLITTDNPIKRLARAVVPPALRRRMGYKFYYANLSDERPPAMSRQTRDMLAARFAPSIAELEALLGRSFAHWMPT